MTNLNMIFHVVVSVYRLVKIWNSLQFPDGFPNGHTKFAFVIIHQGHERKEINLAAYTGPPLDNWDHFPRENFTTNFNAQTGFQAQLTL